MGFSRQEYWSGLPFRTPGESFQHRDWTQVSRTAGRLFTNWATRGSTAQHMYTYSSPPLEPPSAPPSHPSRSSQSPELSSLCYTPASQLAICLILILHEVGTLLGPFYRWGNWDSSAWNEKKRSSVRWIWALALKCMYFYSCVSSFLREQLLNTHLVNGREKVHFTLWMNSLGISDRKGTCWKDRWASGVQLPKPPLIE